MYTTGHSIGIVCSQMICKQTNDCIDDTLVTTDHCTNTLNPREQITIDPHGTSDIGYVSRGIKYHTQDPLGLVLLIHKHLTDLLGLCLRAGKVTI